MSIVFIEQQIISAVRGILSGRVNELLGDMELQIPNIEFSDYRGRTAVVPVINLTSCERTEKERIIKIDAYSLTITFNVPETTESELFCYAYGTAVCKAMGENPTLGGIVDSVTVTGKKYIPPKAQNCGQNWQLIISLRVTTEGNNYVS
jgi:hypothetical protein